MCDPDGTQLYIIKSERKVKNTNGNRAEVLLSEREYFAHPSRTRTKILNLVQAGL